MQRQRRSLTDSSRFVPWRGLFFSLAVLAVLAVLLWGGAARAQGAADGGLVVAVFPPVLRDKNPQERQYMSLLMQAHAVELLAATGRYNDLHVKQIRRLAEHEGRDLLTAYADKDDALRTAGRLGADRAAFGELFYNQGAYRLKAHAARTDQPAQLVEEEQALPDNKLEAVRAGGQLLARLVARLDGISVPASVPGVTSASSEAALGTFGKCYALLVDESFRGDSPGLLDPTVLATAFKRCQEAVSSDPNFVSALAAHSLAWVLLVAQGGNPGEAQQALEALLHHEPKPDDYQPFFWMALYWMAVRFEPASDKAEQVLRAGLRRHPRSLILHAFLGRHLNYTDNYAAAEQAWRQYLRLNPRSPYVMGKLSYTLARLNRHDEAVALARKASQADPQNLEALLDLAGRYIDNKQWSQAIATLSPRVSAVGAAGAGGSADVRGELLLRLGYAYMEQTPADLASAEKYLKLARDRATRPAEWKTRARAERDLAEVYKRQGKKEAARIALENFKRQASPQYVWRQANHDEALAALLAASPTAEREPTLFPLRAAPPQQEAGSGGKGLCSAALGICFQLGNAPPSGSPRKLEPAVNGTPWGSSFNH